MSSVCVAGISSLHLPHLWNIGLNLSISSPFNNKIDAHCFLSYHAVNRVERMALGFYVTSLLSKGIKRSEGTWSFLGPSVDQNSESFVNKQMRPFRVNSDYLLGNPAVSFPRENYSVYHLCYFCLLGHDIISILQAKIFTYPCSAEGHTKPVLGLLNSPWIPCAFIHHVKSFYQTLFKEFQMLQSFLLVYIRATYAL